MHLQALRAKGRNGFTLVELIVTVTVLAIIVAIATPSILTQLTRMEAKRVKTQLENALALAKAESSVRLFGQWRAAHAGGLRPTNSPSRSLGS